MTVPNTNTNVVEGQEPDQDAPDQNAVEGEPAGSDAPDGDPADGPDDADKDADDADGETLDPEVLRKNLKRANADAAKYRTSLRAAEERLRGAKTVEEFEAATKSLSDTIVALERELAITKHNLPEALAKRLTGNTREELEADAKELAALIPSNPADEPDLDGGLSASGNSARETPQELAKKYGRKRFF